jgi:hypothetical protein
MLRIYTVLKYKAQLQRIPLTQILKLSGERIDVDLRTNTKMTKIERRLTLDNMHKTLCSKLDNGHNKRNPLRRKVFYPRFDDEYEGVS